MEKPKLILVAGPTASGKSAFALDLARRHNGVIINADAMQIYAGLSILSAQPNSEEQKAIPHKLYGVTDPSQKSSAGKWLALATTVIHQTIAEGRTPILVGGTGLYFKALLGGLAEIPPIPETVHEQIKKLYDELGEENFRRELAKLDPDSAARLARNDRQRSIRAYEVATHTGRTIGEWQKRGSKTNIFLTDAHLLMPPRDELYAACDRRFVQMIERKAVEEVKQFLERKLAADLPAMKTLGVREIAGYLRGETSLDVAITKAQQATRNYAKRQMTWFRNQWNF